MINLNYLKTVFGDDQVAIADFLKLFLNSAREDVKRLEQNISNKDSKLTKFHLHKLKGSAGNCAFHKLADLCQQAEDDIEHNNWEITNKHCQIIKHCVEDLENEIEKKFNTKV